MEVGLLVEMIAEIDAWCDIEHAACDLRIRVPHIFVVERGALWEEVKSDAEVVLLAHPAETEVDGLIVIAIF